MESAVANLIAPGDRALVASCGKFGQRWAELCDAYGAETIHLETEWGEKVDPAEVERALAWRGGEVKASFHHAVGDLDRGRERRARARRGRASAHGAAERVRRGLRPRRGGPSHRRVGGGRGRRPAPRRRSCPARARLCVGLRAGAWRSPPTPARGARAAITSTGTRPLKGQRKEPADSPFTPAVTLIRALDVALELIEEETLAGRVRAPRDARPRRARGGQGARASSSSVPRTRTPTSSRPSRTPEGIDGAAIPKTDARQARHHDRGRPGPPQGQDRAHRPLRLLRRVRHRSARSQASRWRWTSSARRHLRRRRRALRRRCSRAPASQLRSRSADGTWPTRTATGSS